MERGIDFFPPTPSFVRYNGAEKQDALVASKRRELVGYIKSISLAARNAENSKFVL